MQSKRMYKSSTNKQIMGVCGGLAEYFDVDPTIIRVIFLVLLIAGSSGFIIYMVLGFLLPYDYQVSGGKQKSYHNQYDNVNQAKDVTPDDQDNWDDF